MDFLHTRTYIIGRSGGAKATNASAYRSGSIVAAAAYRSNDKLKSELNGKIHDYTRKRGVVFSKIFLPVRATTRFLNRSTLWNEVERMEKRKDSQFARQWEAGIPKEFNASDRLELVENFANDFFVSQGMIADVAIHDKGDGNPHVHVLLTLRRADENGFFSKKERLWNDRKLAGLWRLAWAERCNEIYKKIGLPTRIDPRSYEIQGNGLEPTKPIGKAANQLEKRGIATPAGNKNREIIEHNKKVMQNILYDAITAKRDAEEETLTLEERKREEARINGLRREQREKIEDLKEYQEIIADYKKRISEAASTKNNETEISLKQSLSEAMESLKKLMVAQGYLPVIGDLEPNELLQEAIALEEDQLLWLDEYLEGLPSEEKLRQNLTDRKERNNVITLNIEREEELEAEKEMGRERERDR